MFTNHEAKVAIQAYVASGCAPQSTSFTTDSHAFWFETVADVEDASFIIINRNGMLARAYQDASCSWQLVKGSGKEDVFDWSSQDQSARRASAKELAACVWLPDEETLSFLPKALTKPNSRRQVVVRNHLFEFRGSKQDTFTLAKGGNESPPFYGVPWKSREAVTWAIGRIPHLAVPMSPEAAMIAQQKAEVAAQAAAGLESVWGMF